MFEVDKVFGFTFIPMGVVLGCRNSGMEENIIGLVCIVCGALLLSLKEKKDESV